MPVTAGGRAVASLAMLTGTLVIALPVTVVGSTFHHIYTAMSAPEVSAAQRHERAELAHAARQKLPGGGVPLTGTSVATRPSRLHQRLLPPNAQDGPPRGEKAAQVQRSEPSEHPQRAEHGGAVRSRRASVLQVLAAPVGTPVWPAATNGSAAEVCHPCWHQMGRSDVTNILVCSTCRYVIVSRRSVKLDSSGSLRAAAQHPLQLTCMQCKCT